MRAAAFALLLLCACSKPAPEEPKPTSSLPKEMIDKADAARDKANEAVQKRDNEANQPAE